MRWLFLPGIWLQAITTKQPDDAMIEVAIASMHEALDHQRRRGAGRQPRSRATTDASSGSAAAADGLVSLEDRLDEIEAQSAAIEAELVATGGRTRTPRR